MHLAVGVAVKAGGSSQSATFVKLDLLLLENLIIIVTIANAVIAAAVIIVDRVIMITIVVMLAHVTLCICKRHYITSAKDEPLEPLPRT